MNGRRLTEIVGSFLLGGGCVAFVYELGSVARHGGSDAVAATTDFARGQANVSDRGAGDAAEEGPSGAGQAVEEVNADGDTTPLDRDRPGYLRRGAEGSYEEFPPIFMGSEAAEADDAPDSEAGTPWQHGLVVTQGVFVRKAADRESVRLGMLRRGARVQVKAGKVYGGGCTGGWRQLRRGGFICGGAGVEVGETPPDDGRITSTPPDVNAPLPFEYLKVTHDATPFFHRLPTFNEQDDADAAGRAWLGKHGRDPMPTRPSDRPDEVPAVVKEYLNSGYYVTKAGEHERSQRRFIRTNRDIYARKYQLETTEGSSFRGQVLTEEVGLPMYFIRRELALEAREAPGSDVLVPLEEKPARKSVASFRGVVRVGNYDYYETEDGKLIRAYGVSAARAQDRPPGVGSSERWVHVDLSEQTLVAYEGDTPVFATLVSTGRSPGMTPEGVFRIESKFISTAMRDQPQEEDAYSIEDVPWTQYFHQNVALHGAFWHSGFGLVRSHGCVNLSPADARWLFGFLSAPLPAGWHAVMPGMGDAAKGSAVVVTP